MLSRFLKSERWEFFVILVVVVELGKSTQSLLPLAVSSGLSLHRSMFNICKLLPVRRFVPSFRFVILRSVRWRYGGTEWFLEFIGNIRFWIWGSLKFRNSGGLLADRNLKSWGRICRVLAEIMVPELLINGDRDGKTHWYGMVICSVTGFTWVFNGM